MPAAGDVEVAAFQASEIPASARAGSDVQTFLLGEAKLFLGCCCAAPTAPCCVHGPVLLPSIVNLVSGSEHP